MTGRLSLFIAAAGSGRGDRAAADRAGGAGDGGLDLRFAGTVLQDLAYLGDELLVIGAVARCAGAEIEALRLGIHRLDRERMGEPCRGEQRRRTAEGEDGRREEL